MIDKAWKAYTDGLARWRHSEEVEWQGDLLVRSLPIAEIQQRISSREKTGRTFPHRHSTGMNAGRLYGNTRSVT